MSKVYIGMDNGIGTWGAVWDDKPAAFMQTPVRKCLNYTKVKSFITRLDRLKAATVLKAWLAGSTMSLVIIERPLVNSTRFKATVSGVRMLEAQESVLEDLGLAYRIVDSREWQKTMLPSGCKGEDLKIASKDVAGRLFPHLKDLVKKDADGLLMAEWARRSNL